MLLIGRSEASDVRLKVVSQQAFVSRHLPLAGCATSGQLQSWILEERVSLCAKGKTFLSPVPD